MDKTATATGTAAAPRDDLDAVKALRSACDRVRAELGKVIVGQDEVVQQLLIAIFARGHCLLEGVPGLAKTLLVSSLAQALDLSFKRIQFTPDLMPSDITGTEIIQDDPQTRQRQYKFMQGPIFANVILADEINRMPPKTQAALLDAMQERHVTSGGEVHRLEQPFFVLATQNPLEQEGTYPLPEAQQDRFLFKVLVNYPSDQEEIAIMKSVTAVRDVAISPVLSGEQILGFQEVIRRVPVADHVFDYAKRIVRATRNGQPDSIEDVTHWTVWGAGPRASINLIAAARARAVIRGEVHVATDDIAAIAKPVMRHRMRLNFSAQAEGMTADSVVDIILEKVKAK